MFRVVSKLIDLTHKIERCENLINTLEKRNFKNFQSFAFVHKNYSVGEVYEIDGIGYTVITLKTMDRVDFVVIVKPEAVWSDHWQDADKWLDIKKGIYLDKLTGREYKQSLFVKAGDVSHFQNVSDDDLVMKGTVVKYNITPAMT